MTLSYRTRTLRASRDVPLEGSLSAPSRRLPGIGGAGNSNSAESLSELAGGQQSRLAERISDGASSLPELLEGAARAEASPSGEGAEEEGASVEAVRGEEAGELLCVVAFIRHGDRTPKQKLKFTTSEPSLLEMITEDGALPSDERKIKTTVQMERLLSRIEEIVSRLQAKAHADGCADESENVDSLYAKFAAVRQVLTAHPFHGINRKVQIKPTAWQKPPQAAGADGDVDKALSEAAVTSLQMAINSDGAGSKDGGSKDGGSKGGSGPRLSIQPPPTHEQAARVGMPTECQFSACHMVLECKHRLDTTHDHDMTRRTISTETPPLTRVLFPLASKEGCSPRTASRSSRPLPRSHEVGWRAHAIGRVSVDDPRGEGEVRALPRRGGRRAAPARLVPARPQDLLVG